MATTKNKSEVQNFGKQLIFLTTSIIGVLLAPFGTQAATLGFADTVLDYFDSGSGPLPGPYGGESPGSRGFPVPVNTNVVLGDEPSSNVDFLSLPTGSFVTVGFTDETVINGLGNDIFIREVGKQGERANIFVTSNLTDFVLLGTAQDDVTTAFDLGTIGFTEPVKGIKIIGLDSLGDSPGFDVANVQALPGSIGPASQPVPEPASVMGLLGFGAFGFGSRLLRRKQQRKA